MAEVYLISKPLLTEEIVEGPDTGDMRVMRNLSLSINGESVLIPAGFVTDFSSWPNWLPLPRPKWSRMVSAGVVHDFIFKRGVLGQGGRKVSYVEANKLWRIVAGAGQDNRIRLTFFWKWVGWAGVSAGSWVVWIKYRGQDALRGE